MMKVVLLGATGLVGRNVLKILSQLEQVESVFCPVREKPDLVSLGILSGASKIRFEKFDFEAFLNNACENKFRELIDTEFRGSSAVICCLGTTLKKAGSKKAQEKIDLRLPLMFAALSKQQGVSHFLCVSAMGANMNSPFFYNRLKGLLENGLSIIGFECLTLVRPSLLLGKRKEKRFGEDLMKIIFGRQAPYLPPYFRPIYAETVASHLCASLLHPPKDHICATDGIKGKRIIYNRILAQTNVKDLF